ncbi:MAG: His/Gly/Thr/Pro-type tRNA ligase C-terminal domain-containing protein, partial [Bradymonadia bacterium]
VGSAFSALNVPAGNFPLWLAPLQIVVTGISGKQNDAVLALREKLKAEGFRVESDIRNEKVNYKVREHSLQKVPMIAVLGDREVENNTVTLRRFGSKRQTVLSVDEWIEQIHTEIKERRLPPGFGEDQIK